MYFYRAKEIYCRYQFTLRDEIDQDLMEQAARAVLARTEYFQQMLVWEGKEVYLEPNPQPFAICRDLEMRAMPQETNGYLFNVSCAGREVCFDWFHFLSDGRGISRYLTQVLSEYCNLRYGTAFPLITLENSPPYSIEKLLAEYGGKLSDEPAEKVVQTFENEPCRARVRLEKTGYITPAVECGVKPFSYLMILLSRGIGLYLGKEEIVYSYSADTRAAAQAPDALYNCVASFQGRASLAGDASNAELARAADEQIRANLTKDSELAMMAQQMGWVYKVSQQKASLRVKKRIFQMGEYLGGIPADFWVSYLGDPLVPANPELAGYIDDFQVWVPPDGASIGIEASSLHGRLTLCFQNKVGRPGLAAAVRTALEQAGVKVLEAVDL